MSQSNVSRSVANNKVCDYIIDRIKTAYGYFSIPRTAKGPMYNGIVEKICNDDHSFVRTVEEDYTYRTQSLKIVDSMLQSQECTTNELPSSGYREARMVKCVNNAGDLEEFVLESGAVLLHAVLKTKDFFFQFDKNTFLDGTVSF